MPTYTASKTTLATRSLTAALSQKQGNARQEAVQQHFQHYAPPLHKVTACPIQRPQ